MQWPVHMSAEVSRNGTATFAFPIRVFSLIGTRGRWTSVEPIHPFICHHFHFLIPGKRLHTIDSVYRQSHIQRTACQHRQQHRQYRHYRHHHRSTGKTLPVSVVRRLGADTGSLLAAVEWGVRRSAASEAGAAFRAGGEGTQSPGAGVWQTAILS